MTGESCEGMEEGIKKGAFDFMEKAKARKAHVGEYVRGDEK